MMGKSIFDIIIEDPTLSEELATFESAPPQPETPDRLAVIGYCVNHSVSYLILYLSVSENGVMFGRNADERMFSFGTSQNIADLAAICEQEIKRRGFRYAPAEQLDMEMQIVAKYYFFNDKSEAFREELFELVNNFPTAIKPQ